MVSDNLETLSCSIIRLSQPFLLRAARPRLLASPDDSIPHILHGNCESDSHPREDNSLAPLHVELLLGVEGCDVLDYVAAESVGPNGEEEVPDDRDFARVADCEAGCHVRKRGCKSD